MHQYDTFILHKSRIGFGSVSGGGSHFEGCRVGRRSHICKRLLGLSHEALLSRSSLIGSSGGEGSELRKVNRGAVHSGRGRGGDGNAKGGGGRSGRRPGVKGELNL